MIFSLILVDIISRCCKISFSHKRNMVLALQDFVAVQ